MKNLTMLDKVLIKIDSWQAKRSTEIVMLFIAFVVAPSYIIYHLVAHFFFN
jgi:hypothetical protein